MIKDELERSKIVGFDFTWFDLIHSHISRILLEICSKLPWKLIRLNSPFESLWLLFFFFGEIKSETNSRAQKRSKTFKNNCTKHKNFQNSHFPKIGIFKDTCVIISNMRNVKSNLFKLKTFNFPNARKSDFYIYWWIWIFTIFQIFCKKSCRITKMSKFSKYLHFHERGNGPFFTLFLFLPLPLFFFEFCAIEKLKVI